ncbi:hypothetical protein C2S53_018875 [Perilla frutescens var. hirtella]|uniref:Uncharacterized protein n=1 Tax=Perilla frutescens var. hirtella TaxID=608512 RepID=A0AAD4JHQ5_PERFH|nr:hypothetical protein C2S53_018875 [Perilla frutescens var. hirtella]
MGKSRGERRVIFSSSGAIPTIDDLRRARADLMAGNLPKQFEGGSRKTALEEEGLNGVEGVEMKRAVAGGEAGSRERARNAIDGGAYKCVASIDRFVSAASPNGHHHISINTTATI